MARRMSSSQFRSKLRQLESRQRQAINRHNQKVREANRALKKVVDDYNRDVRTYNARVRANRQRINAAVSRLRSQRVSVRYTVFQKSVFSLHESFVRLEETTDIHNDSRYAQFFDLSERENANSLEVMNALLSDGALDDGSSYEELQGTAIADNLKKISDDLDNRWRGAIFSLNPRNPDAARHFCTSAREIFTRIFDIKAPDKAVFDAIPNCETTDHGTPTRRAKIKYILHQKGMTLAALEDFVDEDIENVVQLFRTFNDGTHGSAGKYDLHTLRAIKKRVEDGIIYLAKLVN